MADDTALFTTAEARAYDQKQLANAQLYTDTAISAIEAVIRLNFQRIIGCSLIVTAYTEYYDGTGDNCLVLKHHQPFAAATPSPVTLTSVTYLDTDDAPDGGTAFTATELADIVKYPDRLVRRTGYFYRGYRNYKVVYSAGYSTVPLDIKNAALEVAIMNPPDGLVPSAVSSYAVGGDELGVRWEWVKDESRGRWYGNPAVDQVLNRHRHIEMGIGIA